MSRSNKVIGVGLACLDQLLLWEDMGVPVRDGRLAVSNVACGASGVSGFRAAWPAGEGGPKPAARVQSKSGQLRAN